MPDETKTPEPNIMTPEHPRWEEFMERLEGPEGCDFTLKDPNDIKTATWKCKNGRDKSFAEAILKDMGLNAEGIAASALFFEKHGGYCDCEICFNVEDSCGYVSPSRKEAEDEDR